MILRRPSVDVDASAHCKPTQIFDLAATLTLTLRPSKGNQFIYNRVVKYLCKIWSKSFKPFRKYEFPIFTCDLTATLTLTLNPRPSKSKQFICGLNYTISESLVKFRSLAFKISC